MSALTRILNNQIYNATIVASQKIAPGSIVGSLFSSNVTVPGDFLITGNLTVLGSSAVTTVASTNTYVNDPLIVMNNGFSGTNTYDEGFIFNRGTGLNQAFIWNEFNQEFRLVATSETGTTYGNINQTSFSTLRVGNITLAGQANIGTIRAGSLNYAVIGNVTPANAFFTNVAITGNLIAGLSQFAAINATPIGNATTSTGAFTTLTASGITTVTDATEATAQGEGAFRVTGGASIGGNLWIGGNLNVVGNSFTITGNAGVFYGNLAGAGALYAGVTGYTPQDFTTIQSTGNNDGYIQINLQNINNGQNASTDFVATADNGTQNDTYIDFGINSSTYSVAGYELSGPNDGYLYTRGNLITGGGNLLLATSHLNDIIFATGGQALANEVLRITSGNVVAIRSGVPSTGSTSGALKVAGGVGIGGRLYVASGIQNTTIGNVTPAEAYFTNVSVSGNIVTGLLQAAAINATPIGNATPSTGVFTTLAATQGIWANSTTPSTTTSTGAIVVPTGGVGVAGNVNVGEILTVTGPTQLNSTLATTGAVSFTDVTNSISATSGGALTVSGGAAIAKDLWVGGNVYAANIIGTSYQYLTIVDPLVNFRSNVTYPYSYDIGFYSEFVGGPANIEMTSGIVRDNTDNTWKFFSNASEPTGGSIILDASNVIWDPVKAGNLRLTYTTDATSATTGALQVAGGAGIGGNIFQTGSRIESSATNFFIATTSTTADAFTSATTVRAGATTGTFTIRNPAVLGVSASQDLYNTVATTLNFAGAANITMGHTDGTTTLQGNANIRATTQSTSFTTGALVVAGGAGVNGNIFHSGAYLETSSSDYVFASVPTTVNAFGSAATLNIGTTSGTITIKNQTVVGTQTTQNLYNTVATAINFGGTANVTIGTPTGSTVVSGNANIKSVATSTTYTTGALQVAGGVGIAGNLNLKGGAPGRLTIGGEAISGIVFPENIVQIYANVDGAVRTSMLNASLATTAFAEYQIIAPGGSNIAGYISTGMTGSNYNIPNVALGTSTGYTFVDSSSYLIGASNDVLVSVGGIFTSNIIARFSQSNSNLAIYADTAATSATTGALTVEGGVGLNSNLYVNTGATINQGQTSENFVVKGKVTTSLIATNSDYGAVVFGGSNATPTIGSVVKFNSTDSIQLPVGSSSQRPSSTGNVDIAGMMRFNSTVNNLEFYDGSEWQAAGTSFTVISDRQFAGNTAYGNVDGVNTTFIIQANATTSSTLVSINGVMQFPVLAYSVTGATMEFTEAPALDDVIDVRVLATTSVVSQLASGNGYNQYIVDASGASIWTGTSSTIERVIVDPAGNFNILTGSKLTYDQSAINIVANATPYVIATFSTSTYTSAKYVIQTKKDSTNVESMEALVMTDGANAYVTTYGIVNNGTAMGTLTANVQSGNVNIWFTTVTNMTNANVKAFGTYIV